MIPATVAVQASWPARVCPAAIDEATDHDPPAAATVTVCADVAAVDPLALVAVTTTRTV